MHSPQEWPVMSELSHFIRCWIEHPVEQAAKMLHMMSSLRESIFNFWHLVGIIKKANEKTPELIVMWDFMLPMLSHCNCRSLYHHINTRIVIIHRKTYTFLQPAISHGWLSNSSVWNNVDIIAWWHLVNHMHGILSHPYDINSHLISCGRLNNLSAWRRYIVFTYGWLDMSSEWHHINIPMSYGWVNKSATRDRKYIQVQSCYVRLFFREYMGVSILVRLDSKSG